MKVKKLLATNPADSQYLDLIRDVYKHTNPSVLRAAIAYATQSGVAELDGVLGKMAGWNGIRKYWLVGIDYCRSDPDALEQLSRFPKSKVKIFDGKLVSERSGCVPRYSFHPKMYHLQGDSRSAVVVGSGNLSQTGLTMGIEAAAAVSGRTESAIIGIRRWFSYKWKEAVQLEDIEEQYRKQHNSTGNRRHPVPIDEDEAPSSATSSGQLGPADLRRLRVCQNFWIEAGKLSRNRGQERPGNQLMMKRNSRVFFGFAARDLEQNSTIGNVTIGYGQNWRHDCSIRFSDNSMDVLTLPVPDAGGPRTYDQKTLHFERVGVRKFKLTVGTRQEKKNWRQRSRTVEGDFRMKSGRTWGVY